MLLQMPVVPEHKCRARLRMSALEDGDTLETAFHRARIDASEGALVIGDTALDEEIHQPLQARFDYIRQHRLTLPFKYACPSGVLRRGNTNWGATEISSPWADAVSE